MSATPASTRPDTSTHTRIHKPRKAQVLRAVWVLIAALTVTLYLANFITLIRLRQSICYQNCTTYQITPADIQNYASLGLSYDFRALFIPVLDIAVMLVFLVTGLIIFARRSNDWMAMLCSLAVVTFGTMVRSIPRVLPSIDPSWNWTFILTFSLTLGLVYVFFYTFPDGRLVPHWGLWALIPSIIWEVIRGSIISFAPTVPRNPLLLITLGVMLFAIGCRVYRYRHISTPAQRQQTKWVLIGITIAILGSVVDTIINLIIANPALAGTTAANFYTLVISPIVIYSTTVVAGIAVGFSVLRYRIWDVDLLLNRSLTLGLVTLVLGIIFVASAYLIQIIIGAANAPIAFAISAVGAGLLFQPARRAARRIIDRRIFRLNFDLNQLKAAQQTPEIKNPGAHTGEIVGGYQLLGIIGRGGMGEIYEGINEHRCAAIKILPPELALKEEFQRRFEREARAMATLNHPNIVHIFDSGRTEHLTYLVMEEIPGQDLSEYMKSYGKLEWVDAEPVLRDLAAALDYAHTKGLIHRDIKPSNVMIKLEAPPGECIMRPRQAVLMDFGIAKMHDGHTAITGTNPIGTIDYMAPEQIMSSQEVDHRADIYALGIMAYQMLTGELPFKGSAAQMLFAHIQQPPPDPRDLLPELPRPVARAILKALAKNPADRFQTAGEMINFIESLSPVLA